MARQAFAVLGLGGSHLFVKICRAGTRSNADARWIMISVELTLRSILLQIFYLAPFGFPCTICMGCISDRIAGCVLTVAINSREGCFITGLSRIICPCRLLFETSAYGRISDVAVARHKSPNLWSAAFTNGCLHP